MVRSEAWALVRRRTGCFRLALVNASLGLPL
jgi:hypothetical protein